MNTMNYMNGMNMNTNATNKPADPTMYNIRTALGRYMNDHHLTHKAFAISSDVPFRTIESIMYGTSNNPRIKTLIKIYHATGISLEDLCYADSTVSKNAQKNKPHDPERAC